MNPEFRVLPHEIPVDGLEIKKCFEPELFDVSGGMEGLKDPVKVDLQITLNGDNIRIHGRAEAHICRVCSLCLEQVDFSINTTFDANYVPRPDAFPEEVELTDPELDISYYNVDEGVSVVECVREQIMLTLPIKVLCGNECRGLCPKCGANLNQDGCECGHDESFSPFAALSTLKKKLNQGGDNVIAEKERDRGNVT